MSNYQVRQRETGDVIEYGLTLTEAKEAIEYYEQRDMDEGIFEPNFYEIYDADNEKVVE